MNDPRPGWYLNNRGNSLIRKRQLTGLLMALVLAAVGCRSLSPIPGQPEAGPSPNPGGTLSQAAVEVGLFEEAAAPLEAAAGVQTGLPGVQITPIDVNPAEVSLPFPVQETPALPDSEPANGAPAPEPVAEGAPASVEDVAPADPYAQYTIDYLAARAYGGGDLRVHEVMEVTGSFTRYLVSYPSDGLAIYGFMNVPNSGAAPHLEPGPYPVVIALHGYIDPAVYSTLDYTTRYADALARAGFLVIHPNLRGYRPSDSGENLFRVGMAVDVLNLIAIINHQGGQPGALEMARPDSIGLWGHSMGGGITLRVITISPQVRAAVLYGAMSGDEAQNFAAIGRWSNGERGAAERAVPSQELERISPVGYLDRITARVSVHHGQADQMVPLEWSQDLCQRLLELGKPVECFTYPDQPHTFNEQGNGAFNQRVIDFFVQELK